MADIKLPEFYASRASSSPLYGSLLNTIRNFNAFFGDTTRGLQFFPEYTSHGIDHFQRVLDSSAILIADEFRPFVTAEDAVVGTISVLLHDVAMHLTPEVFIALVEPGNDVLLRDFDKTKWSELWESYLGEASRWGSHAISAVLGAPAASLSSDEFAKCLRPLTEAGAPDHWTLVYKKLIGEFIRRHHGRLAHEMAIAGLPAISGCRGTELVDGLEEYRDLFGLIARSHTMNLRSTLPYLEDRYHGRVTCRGAHTVFLMVLLRIADYLHIESDRAPSSALRVRSLTSPFSLNEWSLHHLIKEVRKDDHDSEAIFVLAEPTTSPDYLRVRNLLDGIQSELDTSWAVLGEIYSKQEDLKFAGIRLRRVKSNLDNLSQFRKSVQYIPRKFIFETAGAALIKKLAGPLYGDQVVVGVRELLQNSIDAVNERCYVERIPLGSVGIRIAVDKLSEEESWCTVDDDGIGMNEHILAAYFLVAGATFRDSDAWRKDFIKHDKPVITRSGRFGIGALAAFLLGARIEVTTRHHRGSENDALFFSASIDDEVIEVTKAYKQHPGTTVRIRLNPGAYDKLVEFKGIEWDWYRWMNPHVTRSIDGRPDLPKVTQIPEPGGDLPEEWHRVEISAYDDVIWTYGRAPLLVCNGLTIGRSASSHGYHVKLHWERHRMNPFIPVNVPCVSLLDKMGTLPIDLQRFALIDHHYPFANELMADVARDFASFSLVFTPQGLPCYESDRSYRYPGHADLLPSFTPSTDWIFTAHAAGPLNFTNISRLRLKKAIVLLTEHRGIPAPVVNLDTNEGLVVGGFGHPWGPYQNLDVILHNLFGIEHPTLGNHPQFFDHNDGVFLVTREWPRDVRYFHELGHIRCQPVTFASLDGSQVDVYIWDNGIDVGSVSLSRTVLDAIIHNNVFYCEVNEPRLTSTRWRDNAFTSTYEHYMTEPLIPYDEGERRKLFAYAYRELKGYIDKWEVIKALGRDDFHRRFHRSTSYQERL